MAHKENNYKVNKTSTQKNEGRKKEKSKLVVM
jgi:hypothetical protein